MTYILHSKKRYLGYTALFFIVSTFISYKTFFRPHSSQALSSFHAPVISTGTGRINDSSFMQPIAAHVQEPTPVMLPPDYKIPPVENGLAPVISTIPTKENVVFLGIDDGGNKQPFELDLMKKNHIKASLFLANLFIGQNPDFFKSFTTAGSVIENHTVDHKLLSKLSYAEQKAEICNEADLQEQQFGRRPILLRPPGGDYNVNTQRAAADCGMRAVVNWIAKANGGSMQYQVGNSLRPGDIVLMHFRPEFADDMAAFIEAQNAAGLHTELLEDWL